MTTRHVNQVSEAVVGACLEVHRHLGPGLLESAYEDALAYELTSRGLAFVRQAELKAFYKGQQISASYRIDLVVEASVVVELKSVDQLLPIHASQLLTYLRLGEWPVGLLINFKTTLLRHGIRRLVNNAPDLARARQRGGAGEI